MYVFTLQKSCCVENGGFGGQVLRFCSLRDHFSSLFDNYCAKNPLFDLCKEKYSRLIVELKKVVQISPYLITVLPYTDGTF